MLKDACFSRFIDIFYYYYSKSLVNFLFSAPETCLCNQWDTPSSWKEILEEFEFSVVAATTWKKPLSVRVMPLDRSTQWNLTYSILKFTYLYHDMIDKITGDQVMELKNYMLSDSEWEIVAHLCDSLNVCIHTHERIEAYIYGMFF